ncbi:hypothetical protein AB0L57_08300 [Nocardia sp. NPDC052254]|uniref:hypothetical protein n=1 Tax=Nocardia sp. NPDC052254 TaxID=3155681 RepID=UPI00342391E5
MATATQGDSPQPNEPDVLLRIHLDLLHERELTFVACASAAHRFADYWTAYHGPGTVTFAAPGRRYPRLPCERLWTLP